jgi:NADPH-dependent 2,4-dienoyl-CoA reductase/sulfur reductase-like enzyme
MAENLVRRGLTVTVIEAAPQVMPPLDQEMAAYVEDRLRANGVTLIIGAAVEGFEELDAGRLRVRAAGYDPLDTDLVILAIGGLSLVSRKLNLMG